MSDTAASAVIVDHPFEPRGEWYTTCGHVDVKTQHPPRAVPGGPVLGWFRRCGLAEAAHRTSTLARGYAHVDDDSPCVDPANCPRGHVRGRS